MSLSLVLAHPQVTIHHLPDDGQHASRKIFVVRDDLLVGGTKMAALLNMLPAFSDQEFVYAGPRHGYAQIALAAACKELGKKATLLIPGSREMHDRTKTALHYGPTIIQVPFGRLNVLQHHARKYCQEHSAVLLPFGLDCEAMKNAIRDRALTVPLNPTEVWSVAGSGTLQRGLQMAWPQARYFAVQVGKVPKAGRAAVLVAPEAYEEPAKMLPPFPSCDNYDAKAWQFIVQHASDNAVFWNVGA